MSRNAAFLNKHLLFMVPSLLLARSIPVHTSAHPTSFCVTSFHHRWPGNILMYFMICSGGLTIGDRVTWMSIQGSSALSQILMDGRWDTTHQLWGRWFIPKSVGSFRCGQFRHGSGLGKSIHSGPSLAEGLFPGAVIVKQLSAKSKAIALLPRKTRLVERDKNYSHMLLHRRMDKTFWTLFSPKS